MHFERIIWGIGVAAGLGLAVTAVQGRGVSAGAPEGLWLHLALALGCALAALFAHLWVAVFLLGTRRGLARWPEAGAEAAPGGLTGRRRVAWIAGAVAAAAAVALLWSGSAAYAADAGAGLHAALFWVAIVAHAAALAVEWRALAANAARFARLRAAAGAAR
jgi:hypothetical protein